MKGFWTSCSFDGNSKGHCSCFVRGCLFRAVPRVGVLVFCRRRGVSSSTSHVLTLRVSAAAYARSMASETTLDPCGGLDIGTTLAEMGVLI